MRSSLGSIVLALAAGFLPHAGAQAAAPALRVGTYDGRAIAVAFAASRFNQVAEKRKEQEAAKRAGDEQRVRELEAWGAALQRRLHRQAFARVPVDDLLAPVQDGLAAAAAKRGVQVVVPSIDYHGPEILVLDLTDELVALYEPSARTLQMVEDLRQKPPLELDELEAGHAGD